ncbi:MAG TPA: L-histidine N(alpha)-methyltransferase [Candidatus Krumholzibacteriaceae bacterium]|nr:L-histidine N(alpha)-methyltransferase [Candidatus Krumholzibacteriaceae bacterium]
MQEIYAGSRIEIKNLLGQSSRENDLRDIIRGLRGDRKKISSVFFYDELGSRLFERITALPEYYLYNTERKILREISPEISGSFDRIDIVEIGSGDCSKISILIGSIPESRRASIRYVPVDISCSALKESADIISERFPLIEFYGLAADFLSQIDRIPDSSGRFFCFFGSTIGNLNKDQALAYLTDLQGVMNSGDNLLLGVDMLKDRKILERAYNDSEGVTAEFNRNILNVVNKKAGTDFDPKRFQHVAFFSDEHSRIEMHLEALEDMEIRTPHLDKSIPIEKGERVHTENSHKFSRQQIVTIIESAGLRIKRIYNDSRKWYSLILIVKD